jgi:hypothetical protein
LDTAQKARDRARLVAFGITRASRETERDLNFRSIGRISQHAIHLDVQCKYEEEEAMQLANDRF